ncbi:MAG TPA: hypothetical protein VFV94_14385, partial [Polyangiaceae bacterium]|nr:hypothetical protein [Polyangiaceae bacterium]
MAKRSWASLALLGLLAAVACSDPAEEDPGGPTGATCPETSVLTYESFGRAFMSNYCTRCHSSMLSGSARNGAPSDHNFDTLAGIRATPAEHIDEEAAAGPQNVNTSMP